MIEQVDSGVFDIFQIRYSALQREHEGIIAEASASGAGIIIRGGVARGVSTDWNKRSYMLDRRRTERALEKAKLDGLLDGMTRIELHGSLHGLQSRCSIPRSSGPGITMHQRDNVAAVRKGPLPADVVTGGWRRLDGTGSRPA